MAIRLGIVCTLLDNSSREANLILSVPYLIVLILTMSSIIFIYLMISMSGWSLPSLIVATNAQPWQCPYNTIRKQHKSSQRYYSKSGNVCTTLNSSL
jgi:hypothetical protein